MTHAMRGFTLIELMIVVAIIGILAAIALPAYQDYTARSQLAEAITLAAGAKEAVTETYVAAGAFPGSNASAGLSSAVSISGKYVQSVTVGAGGVVTALMRNTGVAPGISGKSVILTPADRGGAVEWGCTTTAATRYTTSSCR